MTATTALTVYTPDRRGDGPSPSPTIEIHAPSQEIPVDAIMTAFHGWMKLDVAEGAASALTIRAYANDVRQHLRWLVAEHVIQVTAVTIETLKRYRSWLVDRYAVTTVGRKLAGIRRFYEMAHNRGLLPANPAHGLKAPRDKTTTSERVKYLTLVQLRQLFDSLILENPKDIRDRAIIHLMTLHGLRVCEVSGANLSQLDLTAGESGELQVLGKGRKLRTILLVPESRLAVEKWLAVRKLMHPADTDALFVSMHAGDDDAPTGARLQVRGIRDMVDRRLKAIGAKRTGVSCHSLRHSFATQSLAAGASLLAISTTLGHASITTTQVYAQIVDKAKNNPAKYLVGAF